MYRKILVPLDGSDIGECSLEHVKDIAKGCSVPEVILLFVAEPVSAGLYQSAEEGREKLLAYGKDYLAKVEKNLIADGITARSVILEGKPSLTITDYAEKNEIDLTVISSHGRSGLSRLAFGSVADKVVRKSVVPVLVSVPKGCRIKG